MPMEVLEPEEAMVEWVARLRRGPVACSAVCAACGGEAFGAEYCRACMRAIMMDEEGNCIARRVLAQRRRDIGKRRPRWMAG